MKIHSIAIENVRNIRRVSLDLSAPCTVVTGRVGTSKSTTQDSALTALFRRNKKERESLVSRFEPDAPPRAVLELSLGDELPTMTLSRSLLDERGEWSENGVTIRAKGKALDKVQELLPISSAAAAMLLWGKQERLSEMLRAFPSEAHTLLTAATVKGSGPDPKAVIDELGSQFKTSKRQGKSPGALTHATQIVANLETDLDRAQRAEQNLEALTKKYGSHKDEQKRLTAERTLCSTNIRQLRRALHMVRDCLKLTKEIVVLVETQSKWRQLGARIAKASRVRDSLTEELDISLRQLRVARDGELAAEIERVEAHLTLVQDVLNIVDQVQDRIDSLKRPNGDDVERLRVLNAEINEANNRLEANGVRYRVSTEAATQSLQVTEDGETPRIIEITAVKPHEAIVGSVSIQADKLHFAAHGKEDVSELKRLIERAKLSRRKLLAEFDASTEDDFKQLAVDQSLLETELTDRRNSLVRALKGTTLDELRLKLAQLRQAREKNNVSKSDQEMVGERFLPASTEIEKRMLRKEAEAEAAGESVHDLEREKPTDSEVRELESQIEKLQRQSNAVKADFREADEQQRDPSEAVLAEIESLLGIEESKCESTFATLHEVEKQLAVLTVDLKHAAPERPSITIQADLGEAMESLQRETMWQEARQLLIEKIQASSTEMAAKVPAELSSRVTHHLAELSGGVFGSVKLNDDLSLHSVQQAGEHPMVWTLDELSTGERTLAALTLRIAVALSLAEMTGPVFVMLDDSLVNLDPEYRTATERLLSELVANGRLQVVLFTCHTDWARNWQETAGEDVHFIDIESQCDYFQTPAALANA